MDDKRLVTLLLADPNGRLLGELSELTVAEPWWQQVGAVVEAARDVYGLVVTVLRLIDCEPDRYRGGHVTYLAETDADVASLPGLRPAGAPLADDPLRLPYAHPGGPAKDLDWANRILAAEGYDTPAAATQFRTWNLSSIWQLATGDRRFWLKVVPPFFAHEGAVLDLFRAEAVPPLLAHDGARMLMPEIPGEDCYAATERQLYSMIEMLVDLQSRWRDKLDQLEACGLPRWRPADYEARAVDLLRRQREHLAPDESALLARFTAELPDRWSAIDACGLPDTLVHGDFHPGNVRADGVTLTMLDWGDCCIGHPLLDMPPMLERVPAHMNETYERFWRERWLERVPGADVETARALLEPVAALRLAMIYQLFLDNIEESERVYHRNDPAIWLRKTAALVQRDR